MAQAVAFRERCRNAENVRNMESVRKDREGREHPILLTLSLLMDEQGIPMGIAAISKDIRTQKDAEQQAREAVIRRDEFLAMLSHELRNLLGAVRQRPVVQSHRRDVGRHSATRSPDGPAPR